MTLTAVTNIMWTASESTSEKTRTMYNDVSCYLRFIGRQFLHHEDGGITALDWVVGFNGKVKEKESGIVMHHDLHLPSLATGVSFAFAYVFL